MDAKVKISVLMSVYNPKCHEHFCQAVMSIVNQTFKEWEMILYDDGSDDSYIEEIRQMAEVDDRIRYKRGKKNLGLASALNVCWHIAAGEYVARMDADDISKPERLEMMYLFLEEHPEYDWVGCSMELLDGDMVWGRRTLPLKPEPIDFLHYSPYAHPSVVFRKSVLEETGGYRPMRLRGEDYELFMRLHSLGKQGYNLPACHFQYREDVETYKHRKYRYQVEEVRIRHEGFRQLGILSIKTWPYVVKPLIVGLIPYGLLVRLKIRMRKELHVERFKESKV